MRGAGGSRFTLLEGAAGGRLMPPLRIFIRYGRDNFTPLAARSVETNDGQVLMLWIRREVPAEQDETEGSSGSSDLPF